MTVVARFVTARGAVCYALGMVFACFMLGLACAAHMVRMLPEAKAWRSAPLLLVAVLAGVAWLPWPETAGGIMLAACAATGAAGFCVGACFASMARTAATVAGGGITLYVADMAGALVGGVLFSIVVPPVLGFGALALVLGGAVVACGYISRKAAL
jgi:hypothetical protein